MKRKFALTLILALSALAGVANESKSFELAVDPGAIARENAPVRVALPLNGAAAGWRSVKLTSADGKELPAQITTPALLSASASPDLVFIAPSLKAGEKAVFTAVVSAAPVTDAGGFKFTENPGDSILLKYGDRNVLNYWCKTLDEKNRGETYKVFHQLYDPAGKQLVNKGPGGKFTHHRGIFYGWNKVTYGGTNNVDIWHCPNASQTHAGVLAKEEGVVLGRQRLQINWNDKAGKPFAVEQREITVYNVAGGTLLEFASQLQSKSGAIVLRGDPQHAGFHFRAALEVEEKTSAETTYIRPDGADKPKATRNWNPKDDKHKNLSWNAMSFVLGGQRFTAGYLAHAGNPGESRFSERDYGRFGSYFEHDFDEAKPLETRYRIWLQEGVPTVEQLAAKDKDFDTVVTATVTAK